MARITAEEYEAKRQARIDRLNQAADRARNNGESQLNQARKMADVIPFGQPILIGHYSESRDRNYRGRIESKFNSGFNELKHAADLESRAAAAADNRAIFSDDPAAVEKLEDKLTRLEKRQEIMKAANKLIKKNDRAGLIELGFTEKRIEQLFTPDWCGRIGFADYEITNNGANIRRIRERIKVIQAHAADENTESTINDVRIVDNADENRVQIFFPGKPAENIRTALKSYGFHWSPTIGCWQRQRSPQALYLAQKVIQAAAQ